LLKRPELGCEDIRRFIEDLDPEVMRRVETQAKYGGYINRQLAHVARLEVLEKRLIPQSMDYSRAAGLSNEARQKLSEVSPRTVGQASRVQGVTPADITALLVELKKLSKEARH
jgi:tRNA uridine 5-carboxymethylaminomethyl modification enzyme